jgi:anti-sigma28 factor (negative regulator of flagellin synthesis)
MVIPLYFSSLIVLAERVCQKYAQLMSLKDDIEKSLQFQQKFDELNSKNNAERIESIKQRIGSSSA